MLTAKSCRKVFSVDQQKQQQQQNNTINIKAKFAGSDILYLTKGHIK